MILVEADFWIASPMARNDGGQKNVIKRNVYGYKSKRADASRG